MRWTLLLVGLLLTGCGGDATEPAPPTMAGAWMGVADGIAFNFTATENNQQVSGNGHMAAGSETLALTVTGTHVYPDVSLTITIVGYAPASFSGKFVSEDGVSGRLNGSGFNQDQLVLHRGQVAQ